MGLLARNTDLISWFWKALMKKNPTPQSAILKIVETYFKSVLKELVFRLWPELQVNTKYHPF